MLEKLSFLAVSEDPLANYHSLASNALVQKLASVTGLTVLPQHAHEIGFAFVFYCTVSALTPSIVQLVYPQYKNLSPKAQHGFDMHVVSQINAILVLMASFPLYWDPKLNTLTSYTPYAGFVASLNLGYFMWDVWVTSYYFKYEGLSYVAHAATAFYVFSQSLRPFMFNFAAPFIWFEASTPFVNINWFAVHVPGLISNKTKLINGFLLMIVFFLFRIVAGPINGYRLFTEAFSRTLPNVPNSTLYGVLLCYFTLVGLNFVWFSKMIKILRKTIKSHAKATE